MYRQRAEVAILVAPWLDSKILIQTLMTWIYFHTSQHARSDEQDSSTGCHHRVPRKIYMTGFQLLHSRKPVYYLLKRCLGNCLIKWGNLFQHHEASILPPKMDTPLLPPIKWRGYNAPGFYSCCTVANSGSFRPMFPQSSRVPTPLTPSLEKHWLVEIIQLLAVHWSTKLFGPWDWVSWELPYVNCFSIS